MSAVINRAKQHYRNSLIFESVIIFGLYLVVLAVWNATLAFSVLSGMLAAYLPYCLFVYWFFFHNSVKTRSKTTALYRGEGLKWVATIVFISVCFRFYTELNVAAFFAGYISILVLNNLIPFVITKTENRKI